MNLIKIKKIKFNKNPQVIKKNYKDKSEFRYDRKTDLVPNKKNRLLCIIFSENKGCYFIIRKFNQKLESDYFTFKKGMYIIDNKSIHIAGNGTRTSFYLEGVSTPIRMSLIQWEEVNVPYTDLYGIEHKENKVLKIKGLDFDAKILYTFANRKFAELFTRTPIKGLEFILLILSAITIVLVVISYAISYFFR